MKRIGIIVILAFVVLVFVALAGCSKDSVGTIESGETLNYEDDFGGYDMSDESPGFGEDAILDDVSDESDETVTIDASLSPVYDSLDADGSVNVYCVKILWGMLELDSTVTDITDWSGTIEIDYGAIRPARLIRFERGDYFVRSSMTRYSFEWVSHTSIHYDGIMLFVYDLPDERTAEEGTVTFTTGPYTKTFQLSELEAFSEIVEIDNIGNKVSIESFLVTPEIQKNGFLEGRWVKKGPFHGIFFGHWVAYDGSSMGHVKGHWGTNSAGDRVFYGKWITRLGLFKGLLHGTWDTDITTESSNPTAGTFQGEWVNRAQTVMGELHGNWLAVENPPDNNGNGNGYGNVNGNGNNNDTDSVGSIPVRARGFFEGTYSEYVPDA